MLKNILKLEGAQKLTKNEQKSINGGYMVKTPDQCDEYKYCIDWNGGDCFLCQK
ncbi:hypothetical protein HNQ02_002683 [Flavobacterium sp. 7E]|uniref:hypothetical protein n=1 Tax=Flavobacterium sp. 7E TaxID=2735898 RepID=UPI00157155D8|nr:hypothetical protein [Flavobacterium sp. 7E]NRS89751.1 hypothetical protein [Flavobacterium sp. 7E]